MSNQLRFLTKNPGKFGELEKLLDGSKYSLLQDDTEIHELQTENMDVLARDKALITSTVFSLRRRWIFCSVPTSYIVPYFSLATVLLISICDTCFISFGKYGEMRKLVKVER